VHRRNKFRGEKILQRQAVRERKGGKVTIKWDHTLDEVLGDKSGVTGMRIKHAKTGATEDIALMGVFIAIRPQCPTGSVVGQLKWKEATSSPRPGRNGNAHDERSPVCFAAGDVQDHIYKQAVTSAATGCQWAAARCEPLSATTGVNFAQSACFRT